MITLQLKRKIGNHSVVFGVLTIPEFKFKCITMELADKGTLMFKSNCCIPYGTYAMKFGFVAGQPFMPIFKRKPLGFAVRPKFNLHVGRYDHLPTGDIALGSAQDGDFAIRRSQDLNEAFVEIFKQAALKDWNAIMVLNVVRSRNFVFNDTSYEQMLEAESHKYFLEDDIDDEQEESTELGDDLDQ